MDKSNQLTHTLGLHVGKSINKARIRFLSLMILALYKVQTVNFEKLASAFESTAGRASSLRRLQRFIAHYNLSGEVVSKLIFALLPEEPPYGLLMDRTNWKSGSLDINILMLSICCKGTSIPIVFCLLPKGSSSADHRIGLMERYIKLFGKKSIGKLMAEREFTCEAWLSYLWAKKIKYIIRIKDGSYAINRKNGKRIKIKGVFNRLALGQTQYIPDQFIIHGNYCYLSALCQ